MIIQNKTNKLNKGVRVVQREMLVSASTRSVGRTCCLQARPREERAPRRHWMDERRSAKDSLHLIQAKVELYGWSHFSAIIEASRL